MCSCWAIDKKLRPSFLEINAELENKEFAVGKCVVAQEKTRVNNMVYLKLKENDDVILLYER
jgi:hypothetical protein